MRHVRGRRGPFPERPYYTEEEIERTCTAALRDADLYPGVPAPIRIDRFVEKRFGVTISYDDLGPGVLGFSRFGKSGVQQVVVSRTLDEEGTVVSERRVRSTLAHEAGHGLLHAHLFFLTGQSGLFPEGQATQPRVLCRDERASASQSHSGDWWEWQANRAIGALLLPVGLTRRVLEEFTVPDGGLGIPVLPDTEREACVQRLAEVFDVNPVVARYRLTELARPREQPTL
ncbi:MAG TPA: hypothetical protein VFO96_11300 [Gemmatimonadales bacterium]|nr:hypothetical protein [Gemmatimonadales bacterium]